jgi:hypothetical protein
MPNPPPHTADAAADTDLLKRVRVATPCSADWGAMPGGERVRSCEHCRKKVYNLSAMTATEAADLVRKAEGKICVRCYQRADGTMLTQDCPVGVARVRARVSRAAAAACGVLVAFGASAGAFRRSEPPALLRWLENRLAPPVDPALGEPAPLPPPVTRTMGVIAVLPDPEPIQGKVRIEQQGEVMGDVAVEPVPRMGRPIALPMAREE